MPPAKNGMAFQAEDEDAIDVVLRQGAVTPSLVKAALQEDLLPLLPLVLTTPYSNALLEALQQRLSASRVLKLRYMLLRRHEAFQSIPCRRRFNSHAYGAAFSPDNLVRRASSNRRVTGNDSAHSGSLRLLVDMVDLQSEEFFRNEVFEQALHPQSSFGHTLVSHPFLPADDLDMEVTSQTDGGLTVSESGHSSLLAGTHDMAQCAYIKNSQGQVVLGLRQICPIANLLEEQHTDAVSPEMIVRSGDNALRVVATQLLLRLFNAAWARPSRHFSDAASAPYCRVADTAIVGPTRLLESALEKTTLLSNFNLDYWRYTKGLDPVVTDSFVRSAAGVYTAGFLLGLGKHATELGVTGGREMYFRDIRGVFEYATVARMTVPKELRECFGALGVMDTFRDTCVRAFGVVRDCHQELFPVLFELFTLSGMPKEKIQQYIAGKNSLNLAEDRMLASSHFRKWLG